MKQPFISYTDVIKLGIFPCLVFMLNYSLDISLPVFYSASSADIPMHFLGGLSIAYSSKELIRLAEKGGCIVIRHRFITAGMIITLVVTAAVAWEFYEFFSDTFYGTHTQPNIADIMKDFAMGIGGAALFCLRYIWKKE